MEKASGDCIPHPKAGQLEDGIRGQGGRAKGTFWQLAAQGTTIQRAAVCRLRAIRPACTRYVGRKAMIVTTKELFQHAYGQYAVGAYNINNLEQTVGLFRGNLGQKNSNTEPVDPAKSAPFIIQLSRGARSYTDKRFLEAMIRTAEEIFPEAIFAVHLDHGTEEVAYECIDSGFYSSVMIDASHEPFDKNIAITRRVVERAHEKGISVEAELGMLGGVEEDIAVSAEHACLTDPEQAVEFVERSGCDSLAVAIGTSHGAYKFSGSQGLHFDRIAAIQKLLPGFPLVMHGSSSVPKEWVERINKAGGQMKGA